jgi:hypothetical protein
MTRGGEEVFRRDARVFSEDDQVAANNEVTRTGGLNPADADQRIAELIEPIRGRWLRARDRRPDENVAAAVPRYVAVLPNADGDGPREPSTRDFHSGRVLANFVLTLDEDVLVQDDVESWREFAGKLTTASDTSPFRITAADYADNGELKAALFAAGGCELVIHGGMDELRRAVSTVSKDAGGVRPRKLTTNFGWTADKKAYLTPSSRISAAGVEVLDEKAGVRVDLGSEIPASNLDMNRRRAARTGVSRRSTPISAAKTREKRRSAGAGSSSRRQGMESLQGNR